MFLWLKGSPGTQEIWILICFITYSASDLEKNTQNWNPFYTMCPNGGCNCYFWCLRTVCNPTPHVPWLSKCLHSYWETTVGFVQPGQLCALWMHTEQAGVTKYLAKTHISGEKEPSHGLSPTADWLGLPAVDMVSKWPTILTSADYGPSKSHILWIICA